MTQPGSCCVLNMSVDAVLDGMSPVPDSLAPVSRWTHPLANRKVESKQCTPPGVGAH